MEKPTLRAGDYEIVADDSESNQSSLGCGALEQRWDYTGLSYMKEADNIKWRRNDAKISLSICVVGEVLN